MSTKTIEPFIRHIRFPRFKGLQPGTQVDFTYPITALVGPNGTNKTSILRALQACPDQYNISDFWFDTALDAIDADPTAPSGAQRYIHGYGLPSGAVAEVIKTRVQKQARGADYFETERPRVRDGMAAMPKSDDKRDQGFRNLTRWRPIEKPVVYLDFRSELPAYDILMGFNWRKQKNDSDSKKSLIRNQSSRVNEALNSLWVSRELWGSERILEAAEDFDKEELSSVSQILGRKYTSIRLVKHDFFNVEGWTVKLSTKHRNYSEAYAGSGEFAAAMIVRAVSRAEPSSLILLDEPETSLHPGAQLELARFIARSCVNKKHQVIMATHSLAMVEELPDDGRKLLGVDPQSGLIRVISQKASLAEAFSRVGATYPARSILVEDLLAKAFVERVARLKSSDFFRSVSVVVVPGGAETLTRRVATVEAHLDSQCVILLDGDKRPKIDLKIGHVLDSDLENELLKIGIPKKSLIRDGGNGNSNLQEQKALRKTFEWARKRISYLPTKLDPDSLLLSMIKINSLNPQDAKQIWTDMTRRSLALLPDEEPDSLQILDTQLRALAGVPNDDPRLAEISTTLDALLPVSN